MTARILVVDDVEANVRLLEARLLAEYFEVVTASNGPDAIAICQAGRCDVILLDVMMPGMDGYEVCTRLKADPKTAHIPIIMVTALDQASDRVQGLDAGADDFLTKPVDDLAMTTRVKSLARLKHSMDELKLRAATGASLGMETEAEVVDPRNGRDGKILIVDDRASSYERSVNALTTEHSVAVVTDPQEGLFRAADDDFDAIIISLGIENFDPLRLCSQLRSLDRTRLVPILLVAQKEDQAVLIRAIDLGVNDYITRPLDVNELRARVRSQVRRKRLNDQLRASVHNTMEMAVTDGLTGLNNRRYFDNHMQGLLQKANLANKPLSLIIMDIDHFKHVNDTYGHQVGDDVLKIFAERVLKNVRNKDLACRFGGEEFIVAMPDTDRELAFVVADRMRREVSAHPFIVDNGRQQISITVSAGVAGIAGPNETVETMLKRADERLYDAKRRGRNQVVADAA
ncbi:PleD family two-component system response regulator [Ahrensia sp. R2A130]|uniref:PleD family two-component system response regulator n=1 Tax=Ahrensia sp. R2A130 TaxID=744979 RepID=UPI0001E0BC23|nr:PleD family two-component system response regulator [Ahrensia sp. R2A130]EFL90182.1 response regulator PleD [Ahrensia sp. R2A130]